MAASAVWTVGCFVLWGAGLAWCSRHLQATTAGATRENSGVSRRKIILAAGGASAAVTAAGILAGRIPGTAKAASAASPSRPVLWSSDHPLPNAGAGVMPVRGTPPEFTLPEKLYRVDIDTIPPRINEQSWRLRIGGLVERPLIWTLDDLRRNQAPMHQFITLQCISNPIGGDLIGTTRWTGISLQHLLPELRVKPNATHVKLRSVDDFYEVVSLDLIRQDERVMLTYAWDGVPLLARHGFPLRIYVPDVYGMKQPKWIESMEFIDRWEAGYWVVRGWDRQARMKTTSVIDGIGLVTADNGRRLLPIGGYADAGARGISSVEVQVDGGDRRRAELRQPLSDLTWVFWRYEWIATPGKHIFTVRCTDGKGELQSALIAPSYPSAASGYQSRSVTV
jgi:DMSO/TMAO reductase YedYZ molybdopterin-dependent catalytic subunit